MAHDVTEQKRAEQALKASEAELRTLFATMSDVILVLDSEGRYLKIAPTDPSYLYKPPADLIGKTLHEVFPKEEGDFFLAHIRRALDEGHMHRVEYSLQLGEKKVWFDGSVSPLSKDSVVWIARDSMERKQVEQQLRLQATAIQSVGNAIVVTDNQGVISWVNPAFTTLTGYSLKEVTGQSTSILKSGIHDAVFYRTLWETVLSGRAWHGEMINRRKDTSLYFEEQTITPVMDDAGEIINFIAVKQDITERKRAEGALRESEERYRLLFESNPHPMWVYELETLRFLAVNEAAVQHYGYSCEEFLSMTIKDMRPPEDIPALMKNISHLSGGLNQAGIWRHQKKDGTLIDVEVTSHSLIFAGRSAEVVLVNDVTERKRAEQELSQSEERYRDLVENAHDIIYSHDLEGNYTSVNKAGEQITGYTREEALKMNLMQTVAPEYLEGTREMIRKKLAGEKVTAYELEVIAKDGHRVTLEVNTKLVMQDGVAVGVQGIARNITERKQLEDQLRQSQKMEAVGRLAGGVAHDFNNLLTAIIGYSELSIRKLKAEDPLRHNIEEIKKAGERATNLTRQLLAFSRKQVLQPKVLDINTVVSDVEKMLHRLIGEDIDLRTLLAPELGSIKADPGQIEQVILNLVVNARDAMPHGGEMTIETENVYLDAEYAKHHIAVEPGPYVMLAVSDNGCGMDEEIRAQIFEPFFTTKEQGKGTGLGLSTVYGIIKQSKGSIWVYSEVEQGTTFKVYLPRVDEGVEKAVHSQESKPDGKGHETVLLVEDDEIVRGIARMSLELGGYKILTATSAHEALLICGQDKEPIHLMLTDVIMPGMSGPVLAEQIRKLLPQLTVLYMSGYTQDAIVHHGVLREGVNFIEKPFTPGALARKVREVLDASHKQNGDGASIVND
jgi:PAS domain S-box-containing protein